MTIIKPMKHQQEAIDFCLKDDVNKLLWHEVGLGKTFSSVTAARQLLARVRHSTRADIRNPYAKVLVVLPTFLVPQWRSEVYSWAADMSQHMVYLPYSQLHKAKNLLAYYDVRVMICDEFHYLKGMDTQRIKAFAAMLETIGSSKYGFRSGKILALTGTPMPNNAAELYTCWATLSAPTPIEAAKRLLDRAQFNRWTKTFTKQKIKDTPLGPKGTPEGVENEDKLFHLMEPFTHFRSAEDCLDLPEKQEVFINLGLDDDRLLKDANIEKPLAYMALCERINRAMTPHAVEWLKNFQVEQGPKERLVIFCPHKWPLQELQDRLGKDRVGLCTGDMSVKERDMAVAAWKEGAFPYLAGTYAAMGTGHNLQLASKSLYIGYPWSPKIVRQAQGRTNRTGQRFRTMHTFLMGGENHKTILHRLRKKEAGITKVEEKFLSADEIKSAVDELV